MKFCFNFNYTSILVVINLLTNWLVLQNVRDIPYYFSLITGLRSAFDEPIKSISGQQREKVAISRFGYYTLRAVLTHQGRSSWSGDRTITS